MFTPDMASGYRERRMDGSLKWPVVLYHVQSRALNTEYHPGTSNPPWLLMQDGSVPQDNYIITTGDSQPW